MPAISVSGVQPQPVDRLAAPAGRPTLTLRQLVRLVASLGALLCALALPFAPVLSASQTVSWDSSRGSTTALFTPYRAAALRVDVSCATLTTALAAPAQTVLLATAPPATPRNGLVLLTRDGQLQLVLEGQNHQLPPSASGACDLHLDSTSSATTVTSGGRELLRVRGDVVPEVYTFTTDVRDGGVQLSARTLSWWESSPTGTKKLLLVGYVVLLGLAMLTVVPARRHALAWWQARRAQTPRPRWLLLGRAAFDVAVVAAIAWWVVIGPLSDDDGFAAMTMRTAATSGDIGNYYRWFNASEAPFTLIQNVFRPLVQASLSPAVLRLPSALAGIATWFIITRGVLPAALRDEAGRLRTRALAAVAFLTWWLPYGLGLRPESFVSLGTATVLALLLHVRARRHSGRRPLGLLAVAAVVAGATLAVTPNGLLAVALFVVFAPSVLAGLRPATGSSRVAALVDVAGVLALLAACAAVFVAAAFADMTLTGVLRATEVHAYFGPELGWYDEHVRYDFLLSASAFGSATKRLPALLGLVLLVPVGALFAARSAAARRLEGVAPLALAALAGFLVLALAPSKWSHHFGGLAGVGVPFLVGAVLLLGRLAAERTPSRAVVACGLGSAVGVALAAALAFTGPNTWWLYSDWGVPWSSTPVRPGGIPLNSPELWLVVVAAAAAAAAVRARRSGGARSGWAATAAASPVVVTVAAMTVSVLVLLGSLSVAAFHGDGYRLAATNLGTIGHAIGGSSASNCGLEDHVQVLPEAPGGVLRPEPGAEPASESGFVLDGGFPGEASPPFAHGSAPGQQLLWGSIGGGLGTTGQLVTPWFRLDAMSADEELTLWLAGRAGNGNSVSFEFGRSAASGVQVVSTAQPGPTEPVTKPPYDDPVNGRPHDWVDYNQWRVASTPRAQVPAAADVVRIRAVDGSTDRAGWLAVTGPTIRTVVSLTDYLGDQGRVLLDWPMSFAFPCRRDFPTVRGGLAQTPRVILAAPHDYPQAGITYDSTAGGVFAGLPIVAGSHRVPSRLDSGGQDWGWVQVIDYPGAVDAYTVHRQVDRVPGWQHGTPYPFD